ncbi:TetR/AcrR family transcriptional regulator [Nitrospirillum sp. BR 11163]|uniref:TetR/AcrR family transcriptional regulator n=1 Tax=Nitrospirillum sp. BR 11163 TaxID=3104323 RepID=UPI002AFFAE8B|nr:TetR/AcrR family transcriptional regulator [Nitrospirillum sp. BR 11163]MEA1672881.1 TetR/AcrR family transcriptional regulator [Nitrospirillum sp. BR 11163]
MDDGRTRLTRQESQLATRARLIVAARKLIASDGVAAASVRNVAEAAGYTQGAFYSNFPTKDHMLMAVLADHLESVATRVEAMAEEVLASPQDRDKGRTPAAIVAFLQNLNPKSNWATLATELLLHANRSADLAADYSMIREAFFRRLGAAFRQIFNHLGLTPSIPPEDLAMGLISTSVGFSIQFGGPLTPEARERFMTAVFQGIITTASPLPNE